MVLTNDLLTSLRSNIKDDIETDITHIAVGDDNTSPSSGQTDLVSETFRSAVDSTDKTSIIDEITSSMTILTTENNGNTIKEVGGFDDSSGGSMAFRNVLGTVINKTSDISVQIDTVIAITVSDDT